MAINSQAIVDALASHAAASGYFERVNEHEAGSELPSGGLTAGIWPQVMRPSPPGSGLASTAARLVFMVRIYSPALSQPQDAIDPTMLAAADALMAAYSGDFTLGGLVRDVDLLGAGGESLSAVAGWLPAADGVRYRVIDITVPLVINDAWTQAP